MFTPLTDAEGLRALRSLATLVHFVDRERELTALERLFLSDKAEFFVLYGRRRVGKTELLRRFCENKKSIYFLASQLKETDNLRQLTEAIRIVYDDPLLSSLTFSDWESALVYLAQKAQNERIVLILDEFQYLCEDNNALPSILQRFWDLHGSKSKLFLVLCGSHVSFMERDILAEKSPLYGRRTGQQQLMPFSYRNSCKFFPQYTPKEKLCAYGILGGMPAYLNRFNPKLTIRENILNELLSVQGYLFDEVNFLLRMELRDPKTYASLLHAIASGCTRLNEIAQRVGLDSTTANKYLTVLRDLHLVKREASITERAPERSKKGIYSILDNYINFWFRFVLPNISLIESGQSELVYNNLIAPNLSTYMGHIFEDACRQYVRLHWDEKLKIAPRRVGKHWDKDFDIDVLTENLDGSHFFGECKWWEGLVGENVSNVLITNSKKAPPGFRRNARYILFSLEGFTDELKKRAEKEGIYLISAAEMFD